MATNPQITDSTHVLKNVYDWDVTALRTLSVGSLVPKDYDTVQLSYTGDNLTGVVYKSGGSTVATLTLSYTGTNLTQVVRS